MKTCGKTGISWKGKMLYCLLWGIISAKTTPLTKECLWKNIATKNSYKTY
uniref:Uncharacterized protein n=1 Tax=uncultured marine virus TaxID=186617 RepID=A0A0F7LA89_9VIRU|nr:hypothetical protein [uncultured marine virus]